MTYSDIGEYWRWSGFSSSSVRGFGDKTGCFFGTILFVNGYRNFVASVGWADLLLMFRSIYRVVARRWDESKRDDDTDLIWG